MQSTLTHEEWQLVFNLPADGQPHHVEGVAFRAWHHPKTRMKVEHVIAETKFGTIRRRLVNGKWSDTDHI